MNRPAQEWRAPEFGPEEIGRLARKLKDLAGVDLMSYKPRLLRRRVLVRLRTRKCRQLDEYLALLDEEPGERIELLHALSIHVSGFFRNRETYFYLRDWVLPELLSREGRAGRPLLFVSAGCSEGEEPYSLALLLHYYFAEELKKRTVRVVGLDLGEDVLTRARQAQYPADRLADLPAELAARYFAKQGKLYRLSPEIAQAVEFMAYDLRKGLPFSGVSLLACRNVLIYYRREHQHQLLRAFHRGLEPDGYMVLGKTEMLLGELGEGFRTVNPAEHIYRKSGEEPCGWR